MSVEKEGNRLLLENLPEAYAYCRLIKGTEGSSKDYTFIDVNAAFEEITGLKRDIVIVTKDNFVDCNQRALELFELEGKEDFLQKRPAYFSPTQPGGEDSFKLADEIINESFEKGFAHFKWVFQGKKGRMFTAEVIHTKFHSRGETYLQANIRDITERREMEKTLQRSEERYRLLVENAEEAIVIIQDGIHKFVNSKAVELLGCSSKEELQYRPVKDFLHPEFKDKILAKIEKTQAEEIIQDTLHEQAKETLSFKIITANGKVKWVTANAVRIDWENRLSIISDITERKHAEEKAAESEKMFHYIAEFSPLPISIIDDKGNYEYINPRFEEVFGYTLSDVPTGREWFRLAHPAPEYRREIIKLWKEDFERAGKNVPRLRTLKVVCKDCTEKDIFFRPVFMDNGKHLVTYEDVTEQKEYEKRLRYLSLYDRLTGLYNRHFLEEEMKRLDTSRQLPISIIMADLNGLKLVNDTYGHIAGDEMLKKAAEILKVSCRREDIVGRWGGDEFVILLPQTAKEKARDICMRIYDKHYDNFVKDIPISPALGTSTKDVSEINLEIALQKAENDMYKQKLVESKSSKGAVLNALLKALEAKSYETELHTERMKEVGGKIAQKLGLVESELRRLNLVITLHDIGKINISEDILTKKAPLNQE